MIGTKNMNEKEKEDHAENNMYRPSLGQAYRPWLRLISREGHYNEQRETLQEGVCPLGCGKMSRVTLDIARNDVTWSGQKTSCRQSK